MSCITRNWIAAVNRIERLCIFIVVNIFKAFRLMRSCGLVLSRVNIVSANKFNEIIIKHSACLTGSGARPGVWFLAGPSSPKRPCRLWDPPSPLFNACRLLFPRGVKLPEREADHSPLFPSLLSLYGVHRGRPVPHYQSR